MHSSASWVHYMCIIIWRILDNQHSVTFAADHSTAFLAHNIRSAFRVFIHLHYASDAFRWVCITNAFQKKWHSACIPMWCIHTAFYYHSEYVSFMNCCIHASFRVQLYVSFMNCCIHMRCITGLLHSVCTALYAHYKSFIAFCYICIHNAFAYAFMEGCIIIH